MKEKGSDERREVCLSIILVNFNTTALLREALRSVLRHPCAYETEILVIDNGSSDGAAAEIPGEFPAVRFIDNGKNLGYSKGVNQGIEASEGEFFLVLNPDIRVREGSLDRLVEYAVEHPEVGIAGAKLLNPDGSLQYSSRTFYTWRTLLYRRTPLGRLFRHSTVVRDHLMLDWDHHTTRDVDWMIGACLLVRRSAVEDVGLMDERFFLYFEDVDWCYRMKAHGWRVVYVSDSLMEHEHQRQSAQGLLSRQKALHLRSMAHFFEKWSHSLYRWKARRHWARLGANLVADLAAVNGAFLAAYAIRLLLAAIFTRPLFGLPTYGKFLLFVNLTSLLALASTGYYRPGRIREGGALFADRLLAVFRPAAIVYLVVTAATFLTGSRIYSRVLVTIFFFLLVFFLPLARVALSGLYRTLRRNAYDLRRTIVVGSNDLARALVDQLRTIPDLGFELVGFVTEPGESTGGAGFLGTTGDLPRLVRRHRVTDVFCAGSGDPIPLVSTLLLRLADAPVTVRVLSDLSAISLSRGDAEEFLNLPMLRFDRRTLIRYRPRRKRFLDVTLALGGAVATAPLAAALLAAGRIAGVRPAFDSEKRRNVRGEERRLRVFRAPREGEGGAFARRLGRLYRRFPALRNLPALYQVVAGRFSFVGPCPEEPERGRFLGEWERLIATLRPGIYDVSAAAGRPWVPFRDPAGLNLYYVQNWSAGFDLHVVLRELLRSGPAGGSTPHD